MLIQQFKFKLCTDIEKNPWPSVYVDATKTIHAPYCQGNVTVFGENVGQQCVAMSLCALIYTGAPNVNFGKISVRKTICDLEFSEHLFKISCLPVSPRIFEHLKNGIIAHF